MATESVNRVLKKENEGKDRLAKAKFDAEQKKIQIIKGSEKKAEELVSDAKIRGEKITEAASAEAKEYMENAIKYGEKAAKAIKDKNRNIADKAFEIISFV